MASRGRSAYDAGMSSYKPSAILYLVAALAFMAAALHGLQSGGSPFFALGEGALAAILLIRAFVFWRKPHA